MLELNTKEQQVKIFMFNRVVPAIHKVLKDGNPNLYQQWGGNTCRQSAVFGVKFLEELLPEYDWTVWDGDFGDKIRGQHTKYNHAWIYGIHKETKKGLLVDLSRVDRERLFLPTTSNKYPKDHPEYKEMRLIQKTKLDYNQMIEDDIEYYTQLPSTEVLNNIINEVERNA